MARNVSDERLSVVDEVDGSELSRLPDEVQLALADIAEIAREGLLALSVTAGLAVLGEMMEAAAQIVADRAPYVAALRDWVAKGADSEFALAPADVIARSGARGVEEATAAAEFELAQHLHNQGDLESARSHFREAHRLAPDNWTYKRQAWSIEPSALDGPMARFWQGPLPGAEADWAYEGDWVKDAKASGIADYYPRFRP